MAKNLQELKAYIHPQSRSKNSDLVTDKPGRVSQSHVAPTGPAKGSRSGMEHESPKSIEQEHFARELSAELARGLAEHAYEDLVIVANPAFLGTLRQVADTQVLKHVKASIDKDYTMLKLPELQEKLAAVLPA